MEATYMVIGIIELVAFIAGLMTCFAGYDRSNLFLFATGLGLCFVAGIWMVFHP